MSRFAFAAGLAALLLTGPAAAQAPDRDRAETVTVTMTNFKFDPDTVRIKAGKPYVLHLVNAAGGGHSFAAKEFFAAASVAPEDAEKLEKGKLDLKGGTSIDLHFVAPKAGTYELHCSHFLHSGFGMTGTIVVE